MRVTRPRLWVLAVGLGLAAAALVFQLYLLMVEQGSEWLQRSYRNRWGFKDVPAKRGAILDRDGRLLAEDVPAFALLLHYRAFRREHPLGCAVHGANLLRQARGDAGEAFGYGLPGRGPEEALAALLELPVAWLHEGAVSDETARDLRFYTARLIAGLTPRDSGELWHELGRLEAARGATLREVLGPRAVAGLLAAFRVRARQLGRIAADLGAAGLEPPLTEVLEERRRTLAAERQAHPDGTPRTENVLRTIYRRVPFPVAARIELQREDVAGIVLRPSVERREGTVPGRADLASLRPVVGFVRPYWREDFEEGLSAAAVSPAELADFLPRRPDLPQELAVHLEAEARRNVETHLAVHGRIGRAGVERAFDGWLAGRPGLRLVEHDRTAQEVALWGTLDTTPGKDLRLTIDLALQAELERALDACEVGAHTALAVVDPASGDILALGGRPLPAPDEPAYTALAATWPGVGFVGSVGKPFVLLEQLDAERRGRPHRPHDSFPACDGSAMRIRALGSSRRCSGHGAAGHDPREAIAHSCNFFFYHAAQGLGRAALERAYARVGWTPGEGRRDYGIAGLDGVGRPRLDGAVAELFAIGYGVQVSAIHVARAYAGLATGALPPARLVRRGGEEPVPLGVDRADLELVRDGLEACVQHGTARSRGLEAWGVLAKTGTAEISARKDNNAWLAGYLTREQPTLAFAAVAYGVPDQQHGADVAGRLVADFLRAVHADTALRERYMPGATGR